MPTVTGAMFAQKAYSYRDSGYTYQQYDCVGFTNLVRRDCGLGSLFDGTNTMWRDGSLVWQGTIAEAQAHFGSFPQGCYLFKIKPESDPTYNDPPIPSQYYMDGIGNVTHVGIYTNLGLGVMQSGGYGGSGVHDSTYDSSYWTHLALPPDIDFNSQPTPQPQYSNPDLINDFWCSPNNRIGAYSVNTETPTDKQKINANNIKSYFIQQGWTLEAICGMLGNMQAESSLNPAFIESTNRWRLPDNGTDLNTLPNSIMANFFDAYYGLHTRRFGVGLVQWDGYSTRNGEPQQKLVAYAIDNNYNWFDGWCQCNRIQGEYNLDSQYHFFNPVTISGTTYTFANYITSTASPTELAHAWQAGYERNAGGLGYRGDNAEWWYDYFTGPDAPEPVIPGGPSPIDPNPDPDETDFIQIWLLLPILIKKRKENYQPCRRI